MNPAVFHQSEPDPIGAILQIPEALRFRRFRNPNGIGGLARERDDNRLEILAIHSDDEGKGHLRQFFVVCKRNYNTVCVFDIWNPVLQLALERWGFNPCTEPQWDGEIVQGMRWDKPSV